MDKDKKIHYENNQNTLSVDLVTEKNAISRGEYINSLDDARMAFCNMAVDNQESVIGPCLYNEDDKTSLFVKEFLEDYQKRFHPPVFSSDVYPIVCNKNSAGLPDADTSSVRWVLFYRNLSGMRDVSEKADRPFWAFCMCTEHYYYKKDVRNYPAPTEGALRYEAFNALAYGAQGLIYFRFSLPLYEDPIAVSEDPGCSREGDNSRCHVPIGNFRFLQAPIDGNLQPTPLFDIVKKINSEIKTYSKLFLGCKVLECGHTGEVYGENGFDMIPNGIGCFFKVHTLDAGNPKSELRGVLCSLIENRVGGVLTKYVVVVSHDPFAKKIVELSHAASFVVNRVIVSQNTGEDELAQKEGSGAVTGTKITVELEAGGFAIFTWREA